MRFRQVDWRRNIAFVLQDTFLFNASVLENISYGKPDASLPEIEDFKGGAILLIASPYWPMYRHMLPLDPAFPKNARKVALFRNGANQAIRIPREFELPASEALILREDDHLIIKAVPRRPSLLQTLAKLEPLEESFPDVDTSLLPAEAVDLS